MPASKSGRMKRHLSIGFLLSAITMLLVVVLVSVFALLAQDAYRQYSHAKHVLQVTQLARAMITARGDMRSESGSMSMVLSRDTASDAATVAAIRATHAKTFAKQGRATVQVGGLEPFDLFVVRAITQKLVVLKF